MSIKSATDTPVSPIQPDLSLSTQTQPQPKGLVSSMLVGAQAAFSATVGATSYVLKAPTRIATEGAVDAVTKRLADPNGPVSVLRKKLNSHAEPNLRASKGALETYRSALESNSTDLIPFLKALHTKLSLLLTQKNLIPQFTPEKWQQLESFASEIQNLVDNPNNLPSHDQLLEQTKGPLQTLTRGFEEQRGIAEEFVDILVNGIGLGVGHLETLPGRMVQSYNSPLPPSLPGSPAPVQPTATPGPSVPGPSFFNLDTLVTQGKQLLSSIMSSAGNAASQNAASGLATLVCSAFLKIREHIEQNPELAHLKTTINPMIERLQNANKQGSWGELTTALGDAFKFMQAQQVYLQGLRLPVNPVRTHSSAIPDFLQNITGHQNALQPPEQRIPPKITANMIEQQQRMLKSRLATYGPAKLIAEKFCRLNGSDAFYAEIFKISDPSQEDLMSVFRERLFKKIDQSSLKFITKWIAKGMFDLFIPVSVFYTDSILDNILSLTSDWIRNNPGFQHSKEELFIKLTRNWLAVTSGAYNSVANAPASQTRDLNLMMEEAMKIPERNGGLTQSELYIAVAKTALDTFGPRIKWDEIIDNYFNAEIPSTSSAYFLNPLVRGINSFCSFCLKSFVFIPQWIGNQVLQGGAKIALSNTPLLRDYTEQTIESLRRNTPTSYTMQRMLYRQMQKILSLLQDGLKEDPNSANYLLNRETNVSKIEITGLVEYILEVLNKSQYQTQDRLHNYLHDRAPVRDRIGREIDDAALPQIMETAVKTISIAMKALIEEEEMQQILFDSLCLGNNVFEGREPVSDEDFATVEKGIRELSDQVLETAIFHAIGEKFDFTNEKQKRGVTTFISTLKDQTSTFTQQLEQNAKEISLEMPLDPAVLVTKISSMIELSTQYNRGRVEALGKADGNLNFHTETKYHLNELCKKLLKHCNPIAQHLNNMKIRSDEMLKDKKIIQTLFLCNNINYSLTQKTQQERLSSDDFSFCKIQLALLQSHLVFLRRNRSVELDGMIANLERSSKDFSSRINTLENIQKAESQLKSIDLLYQQLKQEKLAGIGRQSPPLLRHLERQIGQIIQGISSREQKELLNQKVLHLMHSATREAVESSATQFSIAYIQISTQNSTNSQQEMVQLRQINSVLQPLLMQLITTFAQRFDKNKKEIDSFKQELIKNSEALQSLTQAEKDLPIWNLFFVDMQWVTETVKNLAFDRARSKIQQLFNSLYQRHSYVGFVNQVTLLPFLEKFGKHHLKT